MFTEFIKEKRFLYNVSGSTIKYYAYVFNRWNELVHPDLKKEARKKARLGRLTKKRFVSFNLRFVKTHPKPIGLIENDVRP